MKTIPIQGPLRAEIVAALAESPWFRALERRAAESPEGAKQLDHLIALADLIEYQPGDLIIRQGYPSDSFHVIVRGEVRVTVGEGEAQAEVGRFHRPSSLGEIGLLLDEVRTATVKAEGVVLGLTFTAQAFHDVFEKIPEFGLDTSRHLARRLRDLSGLVPRARSPLELDHPGGAG